MEPRVSQAVELALWGLREGRQAVPADLLDLLLGSKFTNPMLGILGAHSMLLEAKVDQALFTEVLFNLRKLIPDHPDVAALGLLGPNSEDPLAVAPLRWPPMLTRSFLAFLRRDARDPGTISEGSIPEKIATRLVQGLWTAWRPWTEPATDTATVVPAAARKQTTSRTPITDAREYIARTFRAAEDSLPVPGKRQRQNARLTEYLRDASFDDPGTGRLASYLSELSQTQATASLSDLIASTSLSSLGIATSLPSSVVRRSLGEIGAKAGREGL